MLQFILRRVGMVIPTFIGITLLTFIFVHLIPGDPVTIMAGERGISPERHAQLMAALGWISLTGNSTFIISMVSCTVTSASL